MAWPPDGSHPTDGRQQYHDSPLSTKICNTDLGYQATHFIKNPVESQNCLPSICYSLDVKGSPTGLSIWSLAIWGWGLWRPQGVGSHWRKWITKDQALWVMDQPGFLVLSFSASWSIQVSKSHHKPDNTAIGLTFP